MSVTTAFTFIFIFFAGCSYHYLRKVDDKTQSIQTKEKINSSKETLCIFPPFVDVKSTGNLNFCNDIRKESFNPLNANNYNFIKEEPLAILKNCYTSLKDFFDNTVPYTLLVNKNDSMNNRFLKIDSHAKKVGGFISDSLITKLRSSISDIENKFRENSIVDICINDKMKSSLNYLPYNYFLVADVSEYYCSAYRYHSTSPDDWFWFRVFVINKNSGRIIYYNNMVHISNHSDFDLIHNSLWYKNLKTTLMKFKNNISL